ncbi:MAG: cysteine--tRNA ligase [Candidatus Wildermuthbacteria bacterium RIFCSPHIGHO2_12_FULL_45_9]|nr:MAG: cysteine--tRNA ligase [Candidatus Wildermuthbacteria bacterium RIFCSPHIGHO2_12_FULL_45_9]
MQLFDTLSQEKKGLKPRQKNKIQMFVCGPTVYDYAHIGHARTYVVFDMIAKYLRTQLTYEVSYLQNITDIDDKIINRAKEQGKTVQQLAKEFEASYMEDMRTLGIDTVTQYARATDYIPSILKQVEGLMEKKHAYEIPNDGIYFDISIFKEYGKLAHRTTQQAEDGISRIDESVAKHNKGDFALWKFVNQEEEAQGVPAWESKFGNGRPGWHIEDTAIAEEHFGHQYDIHGGARDLIFPHHEAEITQMESLSGKKPFVNYWLHTGFLTVKGEKMSKSLGNFITIRDFLQTHPARLLRYFILKTHYRSPIDYSEKLLEQAKSELEKIDNFVRRIEEPANSEGNSSEGSIETATKDLLDEALQDDFNTPRAFSVLFTFIQKINSLLDNRDLSPKEARDTLKWLRDLDQFFGFIFWGKEYVEIPDDIEELANQRLLHRASGDWQKADEIRDQLLSHGWIIEDTPQAYRLKKK